MKRGRARPRRTVSAISSRLRPMSRRRYSGIDSRARRSRATAMRQRSHATAPRSPRAFVGRRLAATCGARSG
ncbi:hypothetical protein N177_3095 [Lutibaculum baratangense AMV1]|uniref:Uncharacterized protein n=1 Tax=Lutibaculum baratangense AMV1 TaxID=631454 RepID=V4QTE8_9HYPH|nr:hypothetical protein N177_3095 [Lutibaculum baratangense AMV1]